MEKSRSRLRPENYGRWRARGRQDRTDRKPGSTWPIEPHPRNLTLPPNEKVRAIGHNASISCRRRTDKLTRKEHVAPSHWGPTMMRASLSSRCAYVLPDELYASINESALAVMECPVGHSVRARKKGAPTTGAASETLENASVPESPRAAQILMLLEG